MKSSNFQKWWRNAKNKFPETTEHDARLMWIEISELVAERIRARKGMKQSLQIDRMLRDFNEKTTIC